MQEIFYLEVPTPHINRVRDWLQQTWQPTTTKVVTPDGIRLQFTPQHSGELSIFVWQLQRTTYLKIFLWDSCEEKNTLPKNTISQIKNRLVADIRQAFPPNYPVPPKIELSQQSIFEALVAEYPQTVKYFQKFPNGEYDLNRVYWWEQRWRESVNNPQQPKKVIFSNQEKQSITPDYDLIYIGGALGVIHAAVMAQKGYRVLLLERLPFGRMNREWNISRDEFQSLINLGLFTPKEFENVIAAEYVDGFNKFFDAYNPEHLKAKVLHTPEVLNIAIDAEKLLEFCGDKLLSAGGEIWDETEFIKADIAHNGVSLELTHLPTKEHKQATGRLLLDAMGTASPIAWQLNGKRAFDSVCPTVGAVIESGIAPEVWDEQYGDVLNSHGDISRGRQLIWELFPAGNGELTFYLFHYHQVHPDNPGSLLEMYEDFFTIVPEYRRCNMDELVWKKATFGYIPGHFSTSSSDRNVAYDRILAIGDAASLQSPLIFTGFGSLVRNLDRLTTLLDTALKHDLLTSEHLSQIRAYQSNISVTWLFSKGMMVPTHQVLPPQRVNSMLNTFFGLLEEQPPEVANTFIKDRTNWWMFTRLALVAARKNPTLLWWIWQMAGSRDLLQWLGSYWAFTLDSARKSLFISWFPAWLKDSQSWLEEKYPSLWLKLLSFSYQLQYSAGRK
ncbi:Flavin-dependent dehydrogenase [Hyella patelloides LEGE 07179]|uniref:Flavin-dependent dehydrogenase n=1 Tax=Hyella patelloides LEGE 07179 TaxID=945734 RepID=A0A563VJG9_9CYAN|nr:flavin-dependent dehydrogenase [Hyella patelloides]VEP11559.1 Flavin-dependent dehydrogenase [Hyella patelloides LEGE 07179]